MNHALQNLVFDSEDCFDESDHLVGLIVHHQLMQVILKNLE